MKEVQHAIRFPGNRGKIAAIAALVLFAGPPSHADTTTNCLKALKNALKTRIAQISPKGSRNATAPAPADGPGAVQASRTWNRGGTGLLRSPPSDIPIVPGKSLAWESILEQASRDPDKVIAEDASSGPLTYRRLLMAVDLFRPDFEKIEGSSIGMMLPASVGNLIATATAMVTRKVPRQVNFTADAEVVMELLKSEGVNVIVTSRAFVNQLRKNKIRFDSVTEKQFVYLEDMKGGFTKRDYARALYQVV